MAHRELPKGLVIESLRSEHDRTTFLCGNASLDRYLKEQASQDVRRKCATVFILAEASSPSDLGYYIGYYTLSSYGIDVGELPDEVSKRLPRYPLIPAILLGRLAVDRRHQGQGIGELLLMDALHRAVVQSARIAAAAIVVDAIDASARRFYQRFGFLTFPNIVERLFLPMTTAAKLFEQNHEG